MAANFGAQIQGAEKVDAELVKQQMDLMSIIGTKMAAAEQQRESIALGGQLVSPESVRLQNAEALKTEARIQGLAAKAGYSSDLSADIQAIMLSDLHQSALKVRETTAKLERDKSVSLFEDPGLAILNAFTIPWDEQQLAGETQRRDQLAKSLNDITAGVTNAAASARAVQAKVTEASAMEEQRLVESELARQRKLGEINVLKHNIDGVTLAMQANGNRFKYAQAYNQWQNQEENNRAIREERQARIAAKKKEESDIKDMETAQALWFEYANKALAEAGRTGFRDVNEFKLKLKFATAKEKQQIEALVDNGRVIADPTTKHLHRWGGTPQETMQYIQDNSIQPQTNDQREIFRLVTKAAADAADNKKDPKSGRPYAANELVKQGLEKLEVVAKGDDNNPLRAIAFETMLNQAEVQRQRAYPVLQKLVNEGNRKMSAHPAIVMPMLVAEGVSPDDAANLMNAMYGASALVNNADHKISTLTGYVQSRFIASIEPPEGNNLGTVAAGSGTVAAAALVAPFNPLIGGGILAAGTIGTTYLQGEAAREFKDRNFMDFNETRNLYVRYLSVKNRFGANQ